jgi:hypothetical protein
MLHALATPAPIAARPILPPAYYTRLWMTFADWHARNERALRQRWQTLQQHDDTPICDYVGFAVCQYDLARNERKQRELEAQDGEG